MLSARGTLAVSSWDAHIDMFNGKPHYEQGAGVRAPHALLQHSVQISEWPCSLCDSMVCTAAAPHRVTPWNQRVPDTGISYGGSHNSH